MNIDRRGLNPMSDQIRAGIQPMESRYIIPIQTVVLPLVGSPTVTLRHILGTAGIQRLPALTQIVGVRLSVSVAVLLLGLGSYWSAWLMTVVLTAGLGLVT